SSTIVFLSSQLPAFLHSLPPRRSSDLSPFGRPRLLGPVRFRGGVSGTAAAAGGSVEGFGRPPVCRGGDGSFGDRFADRNDSPPEDRKSTRLNSSHVQISYAVFCLKKKI